MCIFDRTNIGTRNPSITQNAKGTIINRSQKYTLVQFSHEQLYWKKIQESIAHSSPGNNDAEGEQPEDNKGRSVMFNKEN